MVLSWFGVGSFLGFDIDGALIFFFIGIRIFGVTLTTVPDKRETSVDILDYKNISFGADGSNWLIKFDVLVTLCVLIVSFVVLYF